MPKTKAARQHHAERVGYDGLCLLSILHDPGTPGELYQLPAVELLRRIWIQQYALIEDQIRMRKPKDMPSSANLLESPSESEARFTPRRGHSWVGYKVHLTETCDDDQAHLFTQVATTTAPVSDQTQSTQIQAQLAQMDLLPAQQLVDAGYVRGRNLATSQARHQIDLVGPVAEDHGWQAKAQQGFDVAHFQMDWEAQVATCPMGQQSTYWGTTRTARNRSMIRISFAAADCGSCSARSRCTGAETGARSLTLQPRTEHEAIHRARRRQQTPEYAAQYARRAGVEGTISQGVRAFGLRRARYRGLSKTHLQQVSTAAAINLVRLRDWLEERPRARTRCSAFASLAIL